MKNVLIRDNSLKGWEYGMLRCFENSIIKVADAEVILLPEYQMLGSNYLMHFGHGMNRSKFRKYFSKQEFKISADILWYVLMGPEDYRLDLYKDWDKNTKLKILYLFDTFPSQYSLIKKLCDSQNWDILITSFSEAVDDLQKITGRKWNCVEQAAAADLFKPVKLVERQIHFSSYGRRLPLLHKCLIDFCNSNDLYYDYTTHDGKHPISDPLDLYKQYAWHLMHSQFTFSWAVEITNPLRAGHLHSITCRWFEAAAAGTIILGKEPKNDSFEKYFGTGTVVPIDYSNTDSIFRQLEYVMANKSQLSDYSISLSRRLEKYNNWNERVHRILKLLK